jgi:hypothetical protein
MHSTIIIFLIKASSRNATRKNLEVAGAATTTSVLKRRLKRFVHCHVFAQSPPGRRLNDKHPVNTAHRSQFV